MKLLFDGWTDLAVSVCAAGVGSGVKVTAAGPAFFPAAWPCLAGPEDSEFGLTAFFAACSLPFPADFFFRTGLRFAERGPAFVRVFPDFPGSPTASKSDLPVSFRDDFPTRRRVGFSVVIRLAFVGFDPRSGLISHSINCPGSGGVSFCGSLGSSLTERQPVVRSEIRV